jgi:hypothetical protein
MTKIGGSEDHPFDEDFPFTENFRDCGGNLREFEIDLLLTEGGYYLRAWETRDGFGGYQFAAHHAASPYAALGDLRRRIAVGLATRYLDGEEGPRGLSHDCAVGHIGHGCVVVDGEEIPFEEFAGILQTYEGCAFELRLADPYEKL